VYFGSVSSTTDPELRAGLLSLPRKLQLLILRIFSSKINNKMRGFYLPLPNLIPAQFPSGFIFINTIRSMQAIRLPTAHDFRAA
jgi:hypothetical protein